MAIHVFFVSVTVSVSVNAHARPSRGRGSDSALVPSHVCIHRVTETSTP